MRNIAVFDTRPWLLLLLCSPLLAPTFARAATPGELCEKQAAAALRKCVKTISGQQLACVQATGAACTGGDTKIDAALAKLETTLRTACPDAGTMSAAGYPTALTPDALVTRLAVACTDAAASLFARSFGGPHAFERSGAADADATCLDTAFGQGRKLIDFAMKQRSKCLLADHSGGTCDAASTGAKITSRRVKSVGTISSRCTDLAGLVAVDPAEFARRAVTQTGCLVATAHGDASALDLDCGPRDAVVLPPRGVDTRIVLDQATWGTKCGDGSDYAFWIHPAPIGSPIGRVVVFTQGGGSCADGPDCASTSPSLFNASDPMPTNGILSSTDASNPFRDWTKVYLPYCTQDGHTGSGITNAFAQITVERYGAVNLRAAMRYLRDAEWAAMDATDPEGFRPDRLLVLFSGSSAGSIGAQFNYHYILDDLRWVHTTLLADSALGVDNGAGATLDLGDLVFGASTPGWGGLAMAAPYCHDRTCAEAWNHLVLATAERLGAEPEQQFLSLSNQADSTQRALGQHASMASFINAVRTKYCEQQGTPFVHAFLSASTTPTHGNIHRSNFHTVSAAGVLMRDWVATAMTSPASLSDAVSEGTLVADYPGVTPFACSVAP